eukprot:jgi/Bigna1/89672/estExt_fgenesh1_pg.C_530074
MGQDQSHHSHEADSKATTSKKSADTDAKTTSTKREKGGKQKAAIKLKFKLEELPKLLSELKNAHELDVLLDEGTVEALMARLAKEKDPQPRAAYGAALKLLKQRLHPVRNDEKSAELLEEYHKLQKKLSSGGAVAVLPERKKQLSDAAKRYTRLCQHHEGTEVGKLWARVFGRLERSYAQIAKLDHGTGRSNRAKRAKKAGAVWSQYAGMCKFDNEGDVDQNGNPKDSKYDLGRNGAYDGLNIVILQLYPFDMSGPSSALRNKGFIVHIYSVGIGSKMPSPHELEEKLAKASQVWVISSGFRPLLQKEHLDVIEAHWRRGLGLYIFGDNLPYYVEANMLLERVAKALPTEHKLLLEGNYPGARHVGPRDGNSAQGGFLRHALTTGITKLYEGVTVARMDKRAAVELGCSEVLRDHDDNLLVVARPASKGFGPLIVDGAFTKLFCQWNDVGSAREDSLSPEDEKEAKKSKEEGAKNKNKLELHDSFRGECTLTYEETTLSLLAKQPGDPDTNTSDFSLDNPCAMARANRHVLSSQALGLETAQLLLQQGQDPFTRQPIAAIIPAVSLADRDNFRVVAEIVNNVFMGGRRLTLPGFMVYLATMDDMHCSAAMAGGADEDSSFRRLLAYMMDQVLDNVKTTPDFSEFGVKVPIMEAATSFFAAKDSSAQMLPVRKVFSHLSVLARALHRRKALKTVQIVAVMRRSLIKTLISAALWRAKERGEEKKNEDKNELIEVSKTDSSNDKTATQYDRTNEASKTDAKNENSKVCDKKNKKEKKFGIEGLHMELDSMFFSKIECECIPIKGSGRVATTLDEVVHAVFGSSRAMIASQLCEEIKRLEYALGLEQGRGLMTPEEATLLCVVMRNCKENWLVGTEVMVEKLVSSNAVLKKMWNCGGSSANDQKTMVTSRDVLAAIEAKFEGYFPEPQKHSEKKVPLFITPFGPSVYRCACGVWFGDPKQPINDEILEKMKKARNVHFQNVYGSDANGYPTAKSSHYSLHRVVQQVLSPKGSFGKATVRNDPMVQAVAAKLVKKAKGNFYIEKVRAKIEEVIDSYLACRKRGMREPGDERGGKTGGSKDIYSFETRAKMEQDLLLDAISADIE